jgi:membrane protein DedA with SNARE-associated domain
MQALILKYVSQYGYLAIFIIVLLQEMGMPFLPNELLLLYFGWVSKQSGLSYPLVLFLVIIADISGSFILYLLFYHGANWLNSIKPKWIKLPIKKIESLKLKIASSNGRNIFIGKLTPFVRSYIPVVVGLLHIAPVFYLRIIIITALIWTGGLVTAGWVMNF